MASASSLHYYSQANQNFSQLQKPTPKSVIKTAENDNLEGRLLSQTFDHRNVMTTGAKKQLLADSKDSIIH